MANPARLLISSYGAAFVLGICCALFISFWTGLLVFWLGGAVFTLLLAFAPGKLGDAVRAEFKTSDETS